jgi:serine protease inhibitor ecotin
MKKILTVIAVSALVCSGIAGAADTGAATQRSSTINTVKQAKRNYKAEFTRLDTNKDGYLEKSEVVSEPMLEKHFNKIATNGRLSEGRYTAWKARHQGKHTASK